MRVYRNTKRSSYSLPLNRAGGGSRSITIPAYCFIVIDEEKIRVINKFSNTFFVFQDDRDYFIPSEGTMSLLFKRIERGEFEEIVDFFNDEN